MNTRFFITALFGSLALFGAVMFVQPAPVAHAGAADTTVAAGSKIQTNFGTDNLTGLDWIMAQIMKLFAWLLGVAAITLDNAVYYTVVHMGDYVNDLSAIGVTWRILRDMGNILLLFGFLVVGVMTILNVESYGANKLLPKLLMAAVFLNFSLFISEAIIDAGNLFATQFYTAINGGQAASPASYFGGEFRTLHDDGVAKEGISNKLMNQLGLQTIYNAGNADTSIFGPGKPFLLGFMAILLFIVAAFVMFTLAFILIARFVALVFLIIVAPIGFAGMAIPQLEGKAREWWSLLFNQTITAPVLLLMLYVALSVITDAKFLTGFGVDSKTSPLTSWLTGSQGVPGLAGALLSFIVAMGLLLMVAVLSKKLGAMGSGLAMSWAGKASFGVAGFAGRRTIGRMATAGAKKFRETKYARSNVGRLFAGGLDKAAKGSYDFRGTGALKSFPLGSIDAGKAQEGGYKKIKEEAVKARVEYDKTLGLTKEEKSKIEDLEEEIKMSEKDGENAALTMTGATLEAFKKLNQKKIEDLKTQKKVLEGSAHREYAEGMQKWSKAGGPDNVVGKVLSVPYQLLVGPAANKEASDKIFKEAKKSKSDKDMEIIKKFLEEGGGEKKEKKEEKKEEEGGGDHH